MNPEILRQPDGTWLLGNLAPWFVTVLLEIPDLLGPERPARADRRLFPLPSDAEEAQDEWRRLVHPELFALLASAREIVERDLASLRLSGPGPGLARIRIPAEHVQAWISALNASRLTLSEAHDIEAPDMEDDGERFLELAEEKAVAVTRIHLYGWLQELLIGAVAPPPPPPPGDDVPGGPAAG